MSKHRFNREQYSLPTDHPEGAALARTVDADHSDDVAPRVYADWLEENGYPHHEAVRSWASGEPTHSKHLLEAGIDPWVTVMRAATRVDPQRPMVYESGDYTLLPPSWFNPKVHDDDVGGRVWQGNYIHAYQQHNGPLMDGKNKVRLSRLSWISGDGNGEDWIWNGGGTEEQAHGMVKKGS